jgi:hypothetical protein
MFLNLSSSLTNFNLTISIIYEQLLVKLGSTYFIDTIYLICSFIMCIGFCLNLIGLRVLFNEKFKSIKLFNFMKVYLVNSALICFIMLPVFLLGRRFAFANEPYGTVYACYIYAPLVNVCYVFSALIDVAISMDRITLFTRMFDFTKKYSMRWTCLISLAYSLISGLMFIFLYYPGTLVAYLSETVTLKFYFLSPTGVLAGQFGSFLLFLMLLLKDILPVALVITFNIISTVLLKRYLTHRSKRFHMSALNNKNNKSQTQATTKSATNESNSLQQFNGLAHISVKENNASNSHANEFKSKPQTSKNATSNSRKTKISRADRSATVMTILISFMSIIERLLVIGLNICLTLSQPMIAYHLGGFLTLVCTIRHTANFLLLYLFNKNFKSVIDQFFKKAT